MMSYKKRFRLYIFLFIFCVISFLLYVAYYSNRILFYGYEHKIWAHRVNSIEKLKETISCFEGVELDVVYIEDGDFFDVNHPPAESIGLSLDEYFSSIHLINKTNYWIDFKNLNSTNQDLSLKRFNYLIKKHHLNKDKLIIESMSYSNLDVFNTNGYTVSYYLPPYLHKLEINKLFKEIDLIKKNIENRPNMAISSDFKDYHIMKKYFPNRIKFLWFTGDNGNYNRLQIIKLIRDILKDGNVKVLLTHYKSKKGNR